MNRDTENLSTSPPLESQPLSSQPLPEQSTTGQAAPAQPSEVRLDPSRIEYMKQQLRSQQNLPLGLVAGLVAALIGASIWALITVFTGYQIGFMAIGVGLLVGFFVRSAGKGIDSAFGMAGAGLALFGCLLGNLLAVCGLVAVQESLAFTEVLARLTPGIAMELMAVTFSPLDLLFYGLALYYGYKLSFRQLSPQELSELVPEVAASSPTHSASA
jgi:hypothetical protein